MTRPTVTRVTPEELHDRPYTAPPPRPRATMRATLVVVLALVGCWALVARVVL